MSSLLVQYKRTRHCAPGIGHRRLAESGELESGAALAGKMRQVLPQDTEERHPAVGMSLELGIPIIGAREPAVQDADHAGSAGTSLDDPFGGNFQRSFFRLRDELLRWIPGLDGRLGFHARTEIGYGGAAHALVAGAWDEP